jgi:hypothetical protein
MAQTTTVVGNIALGLLGSKQIQSIDDQDDDLAVKTKFWLEQCIREMGYAHWNPLAALANISQETTPPEFGYSYKYKLPGDCLLVFKVNGYNVADDSGSFSIDDAGYSQPYWRIFGRFIHTNDDVCKIEYARYFETTSEMGGHFVAALAHLMASYMAPSIRNDGGARGDALRDRYERILLPKAQMINGNERSRPPANVTDKSRFSGYRRFGTAPTSKYRS